ncbi:hypothetical protein [Bounagaea algeriensis]
MLRNQQIAQEVPVAHSSEFGASSSVAGCRAVAPDQRGCSSGARPQEVREHRREELVRDVFSLADVLGWERFEMLQDVSHRVPEEVPEEFNRLLLQHLHAHPG